MRPVDEAERSDVGRARLAIGCAALGLLLGLATTCVGIPASFSIGILSLAAAIYLSRPIALGLALLHLFTIVPALISRRSEYSRARRLANVALAIALFGLALAVGCALACPPIYEHLTSAAVDGIDLH